MGKKSKKKPKGITGAFVSLGEKIAVGLGMAQPSTKPKKKGKKKKGFWQGLSEGMSKFEEIYVGMLEGEPPKKRRRKKRRNR